MEKYPFIFSDEWKYRWRRHAIFWACWWLFSGVLYAFNFGFIRNSFTGRLPVSLAEALVYLLPHAFLAYALMYYVIPHLLVKGKYVQTVATVMCLFVVTAAISALTSMFLLHPFRVMVFGEQYFFQHVYEKNFFLGLLSGLRGGITIGGLAAAIKLMKYWYVKEQRNLQLQKENISSQLQILKAQVHPHFLFNTLNNIYSTAQATSPKASKMIAGLSDLLRYMLYECNQPLVPLSRELEMIEEYILLEKHRYGNNLDIELEFAQPDKGLLIAPLILLPFVENCFKHGTSKMLEQPWIRLHISVEDEWMKMKLVNGKVNDEPVSSKGIGLDNVKKRLDLLYPGRHELIINNEEEVFIVNLKLLLEKNEAAPVKEVAEKTAEIYA